METSSGKGFSSLSKIYGKYKNIRQTTETVNEYTVCYYLLKGFVYESGRETFGILITKSEGDIFIECEYVSDISANQTEAYRIYDILCRNTVTPRCLFDVLDDLL